MELDEFEEFLSLYYEVLRLFSVLRVFRFCVSNCFVVYGGCFLLNNLQEGKTTVGSADGEAKQDIGENCMLELAGIYWLPWC